MTENTTPAQHGPFVHFARGVYAVEVVELTQTDYPIVFGRHWGTRLDSPTWPHGQVFTSPEAALAGSWLARRNPDLPSPRTLQIVRVDHLGGDVFERDTTFTPVPIAAPAPATQDGMALAALLIGQADAAGLTGGLIRPHDEETTEALWTWPSGNPRYLVRIRTARLTEVTYNVSAYDDEEYTEPYIEVTTTSPEAAVRTLADAAAQATR